MEGKRPIRVGCFASVERNAYLRLFYQALELHGIERVQLDSESLFDPGQLENLAEGVDAIYFHWIESLWRRPGSTFPWRFRSIPNFLQLIQLARALRELRERGVGILWTVHNLDPHEPDTFVDHLGRRLLARVSDLRVCHSRTSRSELLERYGGTEENTLLMYHGNYGETYKSDTDRTTALTRLGLREDRRTLLCFGNIRQYKGVDLAIRAVQHLGSAYQLIVAGNVIDNQLGCDLRSLAADADNIRLELRFLDEQEIGLLFTASDCVLLPYRQITGSGALLAALTQGRGVVASDLPYFREVLEFQPEAGTLHTPGDVLALAEAIRQFFTVASEARGKAASSLSDRFAWKTVIRPLAERIRLTIARAPCR